MCYPRWNATNVRPSSEGSVLHFSILSGIQPDQGIRHKLEKGAHCCCWMSQSRPGCYLDSTTTA